MTIDALENLNTLRKWATVRQTEYIDSLEKTGNIKQTAKDFNVDISTVYSALSSLRRRAALAGYAPEYGMDKQVPLPFSVKGTSTLYKNGEEKLLQWVKTDRNLQMAKESIEEWVTWLVKDAKGLSPIVPKPPFTNDDLMTVYPMGDPHFGMYAWREEAGEDFNLEIAEKITCAAIDKLVNDSPPSKTALIVELGDFFHADNNTAMTPRSGAKLDVDTRWTRVIQVGLRAMRYVVLRVLEKHENVVVRIVAGNHDPHSSWALAFALEAYFHNQPRVKIDLHGANRWYYRFGKVLIVAYHGDKCKPETAVDVIPAEKAEEWGLTKFRYLYHGHIHHITRKEFPGIIIESFRTLAPKDAYHTESGYFSDREMNCIVHHKDFGEICRHTCNIAMIT